MKNAFFTIASRLNRMTNGLYRHNRRANAYQSVNAMVGRSVDQTLDPIKQMDRTELARMKRTKEDRRRANKERKPV